MPSSTILITSKRILIFSTSYFPLVGGAEVAIKELTDRVTGFEFDMVTLRFSRSHPKFEKVGNVNVYRIGGGLGYFSKIFFVPQATLFALRRKYDLFWAMMTYMLFPVTLARIFRDKTPYVLTLQDGDPFAHVFNRLRILVFKPLLSYGFKHAAKVQAISSFLAGWGALMGYGGKVEVIPNGVDLSKFQGVESRAFDKNNVVLITTSRLVEKNAVGDIIESVKFLPESVSLKIIGSGPLESRLKHYSRILNLESRVRFLGEVNHFDISKYLDQADIFVRPSLSEGQGISFIEAMAAGLPVIATPVGGIVDFLKHEETGLFCKVNNPKSIASQVERLISDEPLRNKLIANAKKMVEEKYDWDLIAQEMKHKVFNKV